MATRTWRQSLPPLMRRARRWVHKAQILSNLCHIVARHDVDDFCCKHLKLRARCLVYADTEP